MDLNSLRTEYESRRASTLEELAERIKKHIQDLVSDYPRLDSVRARAKEVESFLKKAQKTEEGKPKYNDPLNQIQDQLGARVVVFYLADVEEISNTIGKYLQAIEAKSIEPDLPSEFGYEGRHFIMFVPDECLNHEWGRDDYPRFFELQVKTLFQHAWGEADHDLAYKSTAELTVEQRRRVAFTAAQAWGADHVFSELADELRIAAG